MKSHESFKELVRRNVSRFGFHVNFVGGGGQVPSFAYTIGLRDKLDFELLVAGCSLLGATGAFEKLSYAASLALNDEFDSRVSVSEVRQQWVDLLLLGAIEYCPSVPLRAYQLIAPLVSKTIDQPDTSSVTDLEREPWKWLTSDWTFPVPRTSRVVTDTDLLMGRPALEAVRWEDEVWEVFSRPGPEIEKSDVRIVPLSVILSDQSNVSLMYLDIGGALWRASGDTDWVKWIRRADA